MVAAALKAAEALAEAGTPTTVWDVRSCAPLDQAMIDDAAATNLWSRSKTGSRTGGIGSSIAGHIAEVDPRTVVKVLGVPTKFIPHAKPDRILSQLGLDADGIVATVRTARP